ncbi:MAG: alpha/beta fold hydrolase [bacterium]|nr:alpha/beta fold hydrolase [bacterium]
MKGRVSPLAWLALLAIVLATPGASCAAELYYGAEPVPVTIWSQGTRIAAQVWRAKGAQPDVTTKRPAILLAHGWGGLREHLDITYAPKFAAAGFVVLSFDYRGWGESEGRLIAVDELPEPDESGHVTVKTRVIREVVDPWDQLEDLRAALAVLKSEPDVDPKRIGIWGTSYGAGHAVTLAATEGFSAAVAQVGAQGGGTPPPEYLAHAERRAREKARGELDPPLPQGIDGAPGLSGTPDVARMISYRPLEFAEQVRIPTLFIDMEDEELFDRKQNGLEAFERIKANAPAEYQLLPGKHYDVYTRRYAEASDLALSWFRKHLMDASSEPGSAP